MPVEIAENIMFHVMQYLEIGTDAPLHVFPEAIIEAIIRKLSS